MASRSEATRQLQKLFDREVLDIHGVAELLGMKRSSVNTLIVREGADFPNPIYELRGKKRHPLRLWWRADIEEWETSRSTQKSKGGSR